MGRSAANAEVFRRTIVTGMFRELKFTCSLVLKLRIMGRRIHVSLMLHSGCYNYTTDRVLATFFVRR